MQHERFVRNQNARQILRCTQGVAVVRFPQGKPRRNAESVARLQRSRNFERIAKYMNANGVGYVVA